MINLPDLASILHALRQPLPPLLHNLLTSHFQLAIDNGVANMTHILVVEPHDRKADIIEAIGFWPVDHAPPDWIQQHDGGWSLIYPVGNAGFAFIVLVEDADGLDPDLLALCHAGKAS